jgi:hypothetical protein
MPFYDKDLNLLPDYDAIDWGPGVGNFNEQAKHSQLVYYFKHRLLGQHVCICNNSFDTELVNQSDVDLVLVNRSDHPYPDDVIPTTKPYIYLASNFNKDNYHPYHLLYSGYHAKFDTVDFVGTRPYIASLINRSTRFTRIYALLKLLDKSYNKIKINWFRLSDNNQPVPEYAVLVEQIGKSFADKFFDIDRAFPDYVVRPESELCSEISDFTSGYLNIVAEASCEDNGFLTEKTYKPIRAGQLFLMQGPPGTIAYLRSQGFDTYDDFLDHNLYDTEPDWQKRTDIMLGILDKVYNRIEDYFLATADRRIKNQQRLVSISNDYYSGKR